MLTNHWWKERLKNLDEIKFFALEIERLSDQPTVKEKANIIWNEAEDLQSKIRAEYTKSR